MKPKDFKKEHECPECGSNNVVIKEDQIICNECGAIFEELSPADEKKFEKAHDQE